MYEKGERGCPAEDPFLAARTTFYYSEVMDEVIDGAVGWGMEEAIKLNSIKADTSV